MHTKSGLISVGERKGSTHEDKPSGGPRLSDDHGDILTGEAEGVHADEVHHPVHYEGAATVSRRIERRFSGRRRRRPERNLKRK